MAHKHHHKHTDQADDKYVCPMHPEVTSYEPSACSKCNMDLVSESEIDSYDHSHHHHDHVVDPDQQNVAYACPMHPEVTSDKPGMCPKCHMALEKVKSSSKASHHDKHAGHNTNVFKQKFWLSLLLTIPTVVFSPMIQSWFGYEIAWPGSQYISAVFGIIIFFYGGLVFLRSAHGEIAARQPGMMTLISMAITVAFIYSSLVTLGLVAGMDFWWELATLVTIMLLGHWIEMASVENAQGALDELAKLLPDEAELVDGKTSRTVSVSQLHLGDKILVRPGASIPVDGVVAKGKSSVNESMITGESQPVSKSIGSEVIGGTINTGGALTIEVTKLGDDTALAGIMKLVEEAQTSKSKTQVLADKAAFYLTFVSLGAALLTIAGWWLAGGSAGFIFERVVTVLVIACPHALGLAIPLVTAISTTKAARHGLLVRDRLALEEARNIDIVLFDKTGTLTKGEQGVTGIVAKDAKRTLALAAALEAESEHPIARSIVDYAKQQKVTTLQVSDFDSLAGRGVSAVLGKTPVYAGGPRLLQELDLKLPKDLQIVSNQASNDGKAAIYIIEDEAVLGVIMLADTIRQESRQAIADLQANGKQVAMLTGDSQGVAAWVAAELGIDQYFAEVLPADKADTVKQLQADGSRVAMVGDGVNDAPALAQADIGIAIGAGTDVAIESAGIVLASSDPRGVSKIITLSKATYRKMLQNLVWATGYNALALPLAAGVTAGVGFVLSPAVGAVLMSLSTIVVAINAQLLRRLRL